MKYAFCALFILLFVNLVHALPPVENLSISYEINNDMSVNEEIMIAFSNALNSSFTYTLQGKIHNIEVFGDGEQLIFTIEQKNDKITLKIESQGKANITIKFVSDDMVFSNNDVQQFFSYVNFDVDINQMNAEVRLPDGYGLFENSFTPLDGQVSTDGKNIIVEWNFLDTKSIIFSVKFQQLNKQENFTLLLLATSSAIVVFLAWFFVKKSRNDFFIGFREDEKNVINYLMNHKLSYQNAIEKEFHFSRAKMTRIVKHLESKQLIEKKKYGRTNKLIWKNKN
ncbi:MAG: hypothetical protein HY513_05730, partial [Candidatus Aenigmarchaeota archaeon]|nr:hypothetical protein [Candidatus Aenigmarchaeota archaeon]